MRPIVPYVIVAINATVQTPVMTNPIGSSRMLIPGRTNGAPDATTRVWIGATATWAFVGGVTDVAAELVENSPLTNVASSEERDVLTVEPVAVVPVNVTAGMRVF